MPDFHFYDGETYVGKRPFDTRAGAEAIASRHRWTIGEEPAPRGVPVEEKREAASLTRAQFLKACVRAEIITAEVAEEASSGQWPVAFDTFIEGLTSDQRIEAKATWADGKTVWRTDKTLTLVAADLGVSDEQLDMLFKIV